MYRGGADQKIRKYWVANNFIDCIIQLPSNLFFAISNLYTVENLERIYYEFGPNFLDRHIQSQWAIYFFNSII